jgi:hypothetical protein
MSNSSHTGSIDGLWHSTAMGAHYDALFGPLARLFGAVVMHDRNSLDPAVGRRGGMVWLGDNSIELGEPIGEASPVRSFVERLGGGMHSAALRIDDVATVRARLAAHGVDVASEYGDAVLFTRPAHTGGLLFEWSAMHTDDDPRWGYELPAPAFAAPTPVAPVRQYAFVTAVVVDPVATAARLASLFGTAVLRAASGAGPGEIGAVVSLVDCILVLFALPAERRMWPWGTAPGRTRFHGHGLLVDDLDASLAALRAAGVATAGRLEHCAFLDPEALPLPTFLCDRLFDEDPRSTSTGSK